MRQNPDLLKLTRDELMRHEAAGITTNAFPKTLRMGGVDCAATYLHEPDNPHDNLTVTVASASFADKNVGTGKVLTVFGLTLGGTDAGNYSFAVAMSMKPPWSSSCTRWRRAPGWLGRELTGNI